MTDSQMLIEQMDKLARTLRDMGFTPDSLFSEIELRNPLHADLMPKSEPAVKLVQSDFLNSYLKWSDDNGRNKHKR